MPKIHLRSASVNVVLRNNISPWSISGLQEEWSTSNNIVVQSNDPDGENYVGDLFVNGLAGANATIADLKPTPGGMIEKQGAGVLQTPVRLDDSLPREIFVQVGDGPDLAAYRRVDAD